MFGKYFVLIWQHLRYVMFCSWYFNCYFYLLFNILAEFFLRIRKMLAFHLFFYILICQSVVIISPHKYSFKNAWLQLVNPQYLCDVNDHCFITDVEKSHSGFFSTKTAYRFAKRPNSDDEYYIPSRSIYLKF